MSTTENKDWCTILANLSTMCLSCASPMPIPRRCVALPAQRQFFNDRPELGAHSQGAGAREPEPTTPTTILTHYHCIRCIQLLLLLFATATAAAADAAAAAGWTRIDVMVSLAWLSPLSLTPHLGLLLCLHLCLLSLSRLPGLACFVDSVGLLVGVLVGYSGHSAHMRLLPRLRPRAVLR